MASRTINLNSIITGTVDCSNNVNVRGKLDVASTIALRESGIANGQGTKIKLRGTTTGDNYQIEYNNAVTTSPNNLDIRLVGADDAGSNRRFDFGYYTSDSSANAWNSRVKLNAYSGLLTTRFLDVGTTAAGQGSSISMFNTANNSFGSGIFLNKSINGGNTINGSELNYIYFQGYANGAYRPAALILCAQNGASSGNNVPGELIFYTGSTSGVPERMRITTNGTVSIGTSTPATTSNPRLYVQSNFGIGGWEGFSYFGGTTRGVIAGSYPDGGANQRATIGAHSAALNSWEKLTINPGSNTGFGAVYDPSYRIQLDIDSAFKPTTSTWSYTSDARIKKNIEDANLDICYDNIKNMKLRRFEWDSEYYDNTITKDRKVLGFIAQEVYQKFPKAVDIHEKYDFNVKQYDESGNIIIDEVSKLPKTITKTLENVHTLNSDQIDKTHIGATQMLIKKVEALEATNATLINRIESLEAMNSILMSRLEALEQKA